MIWYDMIWHDMIWYDMIWYDMIWCSCMFLFWKGFVSDKFCFPWSTDLAARFHEGSSGPWGSIYERLRKFSLCRHFQQETIWEFAKLAESNKDHRISLSGTSDFASPVPNLKHPRLDSCSFCKDHHDGFRSSQVSRRGLGEKNFVVSDVLLVPT